MTDEREMPQEWEVMVTTILSMLASREIDADHAASWLKALTEFAEVTYA